MHKIPTTILTGFLGAGKTTLLNHLLSHESGERIAVIVNEYGEVGIDGQLVVGTQDEVIELSNGCLCCTVRGDLIAAIGDLMASGRPIDRIVIETSGLADPAPVIQSFVLDDVLSRRPALDAIVTVVDARHLPLQLSQDEAREQIAFADVILLNKTDLVDAAAQAAAERDVRRLNPMARLHRTRDCAVERAHVFDIGAFDLQNLLRIDPALLDAHEHEHDADIACIAVRHAGALDPVQFNRFLSQLVAEKGADLLRMKGIVDFAGEARRYVFHGVHMTLDGRPGRPWAPGEVRLNQIVFIGRGLDAAMLTEGVASCQAKLPALAS
ncbi:GTP-binding protein [Aquabacter sp. CN5-332]|uniref:CobW family GTP-binding protein n=1 Tax=Aquabacter sp. CN5-332 TaxID=3156608 RepID=UPI0032B51179